jgi:hypothetical protein
MSESHHATGRGVSDAGSSGMPFRHLDGLELIRQLWEAHPCGETATKSPVGDEAVAPPAGATRPGADFLTDPFTPEDLERLMTALARCWSVER